jgi:hypothetical protein
MLDCGEAFLAGPRVSLVDEVSQSPEKRYWRLEPALFDRAEFRLRTWHELGRLSLAHSGRPSRSDELVGVDVGPRAERVVGASRRLQAVGLVVLDHAGHLTSRRSCQIVQTINQSGLADPVRMVGEPLCELAPEIALIFAPPASDRLYGRRYSVGGFGKQESSTRQVVSKGRTTDPKLRREF